MFLPPRAAPGPVSGQLRGVIRGECAAARALAGHTGAASDMASRQPVFEASQMLSASMKATSSASRR